MFVNVDVCSVVNALVGDNLLGFVLYNLYFLKLIRVNIWYFESRVLILRFSEVILYY